ncbi:MAG: class I SAM-dependent rRNA methyltransferase [Gemmatimonadetes bacterium]|nr:class I SAM-dependent rRNA methyltransferase [Gemmatimonadota bacterium]
MTRPVAIVSGRGAGRWQRGHPWIYKSDVIEAPGPIPGVVTVREKNGRAIGVALWSPASEISLRMLDRDPDAALGGAWWESRLRDALDRRDVVERHATAYRVVHGEGDALPSLVVDRYARWIVVQFMSAGLESCRGEIVDALGRVLEPAGILARNDVAVRRREGLAESVELLAGDVPRTIEVEEHGVRYLAAPWDGQKTGAFLDQRENRAAIAHVSCGRALDCFAYHGSFAIHLARGAREVIALDASAPALARARENAALNGFAHVQCVEADAFEWLREAERRKERFDTIALDPPAFAKNKASLPSAIRGYKEVNLRAMRLVASGGHLFTASCSFHLGKAAFLEMLQEAAQDSGRRLALRAIYGQPVDHPEVLGIPETGYIKGAMLEAVD